MKANLEQLNFHSIVKTAQWFDFIKLTKFNGLTFYSSVMTYLNRIALSSNFIYHGDFISGIILMSIICEIQVVRVYGGLELFNKWCT